MTEEELVEAGIFVVLKTTEDALLLTDYDEEEFWIPKSQIDDAGGIDKDSGVGAHGELIIPEWLAFKKGMI